jgi:hypothetical protein
VNWGCQYVSLADFYRHMGSESAGGTWDAVSVKDNLGFDNLIPAQLADKDMSGEPILYAWR